VALDVRTALLTSLALLAFAANSLLAREALGARAIDASMFTAIRLGAGAATLALLVRLRPGNTASLRPRGPWGPLALFAYAWLFSSAYLRIGAAAGALVLFGSVQLTMLGAGIARGQRPHARGWAGIALAMAGLLWLLLPSASRPDPLGFAQMAVAGVAWGVYTLLGKQAGEPLAANARSFVWSCPLAVAALLLLPGEAATSGRGALLAVVSGALTSGIGYAIWYRALPRLAVTTAAVCQLAVPVIAALGAVVLLAEALTARLAIAAALVLGGIGLVLAAPRRA
jgi:drug/metabolite transporter (DMT)-like permease